MTIGGASPIFWQAIRIYEFLFLIVLVPGPSNWCGSPLQCIPLRHLVRVGALKKNLGESLNILRSRRFSDMWYEGYCGSGFRNCLFRVKYEIVLSTVGRYYSTAWIRSYAQLRSLAPNAVVMLVPIWKGWGQLVLCVWRKFKRLCFEENESSPTLTQCSTKVV